MRKDGKTSMKPYPLGAQHQGRKVRFSFISREKSCGIILSHGDAGEEPEKIPFSDQERVGAVYCKCLEGLEPGKHCYQFYQGETVVPDPYARAFEGRNIYGQPQDPQEMWARIPTGKGFDWKGDVCPRIPYDKVFVYGMHVRGFTAHSSSGVKHPGTYLGVLEKLPYLKETGITTVEFQPVYEFLEAEEKQFNYWGYKEGFYYAPKAAYSAGEDPVKEFKTLVREFHKEGLEVILQFYFPEKFSRGEILEILRFWVLEYHVDGFRLMGSDLPLEMIAEDPLLADTKLWHDYYGAERLFAGRNCAKNSNLAQYREDYLRDMRRFLKGDMEVLERVLHHMCYLPEQGGRIHYLSNYSGFTLMDMVSYDYKHNEANGEDNRDGISQNYSWNCGAEGPTKKKKIQELRRRQVKNAMCLLLFSQSAPLIFMGDEFGNSQQGNNNPYCQDNEITWLDWKDLEKNKELYEFFKVLVALRREHPILRPARRMRMMDYRACGYPDLSYHGENAWQPRTDSHIRHIGIMYCGKYAKREEGEDDFFYLAMNMHWEEHDLALPRLPKGLVWQPAVATGEIQTRTKGDPLICSIPPRSVILFQSRRECEEK